MITGLNTVPSGLEIKDCVSNCHITLDLVCFSLYAVVDTNMQFWTATYSLLQLHTVVNISRNL